MGRNPDRTRSGRWSSYRRAVRAAFLPDEHFGPNGARVLSLYLKDAPQTKYIAIASDGSWGRSSNNAFEEQIKKVGKVMVDKIFAPIANKDYSPYITKILQSGAEGCYVALLGDEARSFYSQAAQYGLAQRIQFVTEVIAQADIKVLGKDAIGLVGSARYPLTYDTPENINSARRTLRNTRSFQTGRTAKCIRR